MSLRSSPGNGFPSGNQRARELLVGTSHLISADAFVSCSIATVSKGLVALAAEGIPAYVKIVGEGHVETMMRAAKYLISVRNDLHATITP